MDMIYKNKKLEKLLTSKKELNSTYGAKIAKNLMVCMKAIELADNLSEVPHEPPTRRHKLQGDMSGYFSVGNNNHGYRIIFRPVEENENLIEINEIEIIKVEDNHG